MTDKTDKTPSEKAANRTAIAREARLKAALKANMARRKQQAKARGAEKNSSVTGPGDNSGNSE